MSVDCFHPVTSTQAQGEAASALCIYTGNLPTIHCFSAQLPVDCTPPDPHIYLPKWHATYSPAKYLLQSYGLYP